MLQIIVKITQQNFLCMGRGQDKPAWTACPPGVKITRAGGKLSRGQDKLGHRSSARTINIKTSKHSPLTSCQNHELHCLADVIVYMRLYNIVSCTQLYYGLYCSDGTCPWGSTLYCGHAMVKIMLNGFIFCYKQKFLMHA